MTVLAGRQARGDLKVASYGRGQDDRRGGAGRDRPHPDLRSTPLPHAGEGQGQRVRAWGGNA